VVFALSLLLVLLLVLLSVLVPLLLVGVCTLTLDPVTSKVVLGSRFMASRTLAFAIKAFCSARVSLFFLIRTMAFAARALAFSADILA